MLLSNGLTFFIKGNPVFINGPKNSYPILCNCIFDNFILADEPFPKALRSFETFVLVKSSL